MKTNIFLIASCIVLGLSTSCKKDHEDPDFFSVPKEFENMTTENKQKAMIKEHIEARELAYLILEQVESNIAGEVESDNTTGASEENTITYPSKEVKRKDESKEWPKTITLDYGTENHAITTSKVNNAKAKGKLIITKSGAYYSEKTAINVTLKDFYIADKKVEGTIKMTTKSNTDFQIEYDIKITMGTYTCSYISNEKKHIYEGSNTPKNILDDKYKTYTSTKIITSKNLGFFVKCSEGINENHSSRYPLSGMEKYETTKFKFTVDNGDDEVDSFVTIKSQEGKIDLNTINTLLKEDTSAQ